MPHLLPIFVDGTPAFRTALDRLAARGACDLDAVEPAVREIIAAVRRDGDEAVRGFVKRFEKRSPGALVTDASEGGAALARLDPAVREGLELAAARIERFHR